MKINLVYIIKHSDTLWNSIRWNDSAPKCKCGCEDLYATGDHRYKCKQCGYTFSDTANTILQNSKLPKWKWLYAIYTLSAQRSISVRELAAMIEVSKSTAWLMLQKIRYYMNLDDVDLSGVCCLDEAHIGGWSGMHLNKKMEYLRKHHYLPKGETKYTKQQILAASSEKKQHILCAVNSEGKAKVTHVEGQITKQVIKEFVKTYGITHIISDESMLYRGIKGVTTEQSNHSKHIFMTEGGHTSNPCENRFSWVKRILGTYHTHAKDKYLQLYLNQIIFKMNHSHLSVEERFLELGKLCCTQYVSNATITSSTPQYSTVKPEPDWQAIVDSCPLFAQIEDRHHKIYR